MEYASRTHAADMSFSFDVEEVPQYIFGDICRENVYDKSSVNLAVTNPAELGDVP